MARHSDREARFVGVALAAPPGVTGYTCSARNSHWHHAGAWNGHGFTYSHGGQRPNVSEQELRNGIVRGIAKHFRNTGRAAVADAWLAAWRNC